MNETMEPSKHHKLCTTIFRNAYIFFCVIILNNNVYYIQYALT